MATVKFLETGTDATQDFTFFPGGTFATNGTISSDTVQQHTGPRSIKCDITSSGGNAYADTADNLVSDAGAAISMWARFSTATPATDTLFFAITVGIEGTKTMALGITTAGKLQICGKSCTAKVGATVLSANTWYRITFAYIVTTSSNWSITCYLNGTSEVTSSNADGTLASTGGTDLMFGIQAGSAVNMPTPAVMTIWLDDLYCDNRSDKTDPGTTGDSVRVTAKRPNANGTANNFNTQIGVGGSGYGSGHSPQVNEQPLSTSNGWAKIGAGAAVTEEYTVENVSTGDVNVTGATFLGVVGWVFTKSLVGETAQIVVDGTASNITTTTSAAFYMQNSATPTVFPAGTGTDVGEITSTDLTTVSLYECGIVVAYTPGAGATFNPGWAYGATKTIGGAF